MTELPTTFGKYFLTEKLATGGMAEIYLAKLVGPGGFEKQLVIKQIHPKLTGQRHFVDLFVTEAKTLVTLTHGNIVPVYELGVIDDRYFIAMEYIDGPTLYRLTEALARAQTRMPPPLAAWICARILEGLDYAHRKGEGVIHRDLSPRNVMLSRDGDVKLVDFGIAVTLGATDDGGTESGPTGSFPYMSPEQVRREALSGQTDLFSAGVLLWEMLAGQRLFARKDPDETLAAVTAGTIARPSTINPDIPARLDEVVMRALERDQDARWPSAGDMLAQLQRYLYALDEPPGPRDLAALVAKYCPPETRRQPTHAETPTGDTEVTPHPPGPRTAVIPRDGAQPQGKTRARTETFATNVELKNMLERATPMFGVDILEDPKVTTPRIGVDVLDDRKPATSGRGGDGTRAPSGRGGGDDEPVEIEPRTSQRSIPRAERSSITEVEPARPLPGGTPLPVPGRTPPSRGLLVLLAIGTLLLGAVAIVMFLRARGRDAEVDAGIAIVTPDATTMGIDPPLDAVDAPADAPAIDIDAPPATMAIDATTAVIDAATAGMAVDAAPRIRLDANGAAPIDAPKTTIDAAPKSTGTATLKVGANPWGEVVIDGVARGRTPLELALPAGKHVVEVIFKGEDPPRTSKKTVDLTAGETELVDVDFTKN